MTSLPFKFNALCINARMVKNVEIFTGLTEVEREYYLINMSEGVPEEELPEKTSVPDINPTAEFTKIKDFNESKNLM